MARPVFKKDFEALKHDVMALRDELKLQMHLANMDAKKRWEQLEPKAEHVWDDVSERSLQAAKELKKAYLELKAQLKRN